MCYRCVGHCSAVFLGRNQSSPVLFDTSSLETMKMDEVWHSMCNFWNTHQIMLFRRQIVSISLEMSMQTMTLHFMTRSLSKTVTQIRSEHVVASCRNCVWVFVLVCVCVCVCVCVSLC